MNKTVNINLANILFHIDEKAYNKLQRYLEVIKKSFAGTAGSDEIIADIEARIAELFHEKMENERQVVTLKEVDEVINIMGQPEDYMVDEDIFEDEPRPKTGANRPKVKKLYRDIDDKYIGGVCSGLEHYLGVDALWIRLAFILLALFTGFGFIAYILLWILVPEAATTSQKLNMKGEPVNISNIERKVKEGFDDVADRVKNVDYDKVGNKVKSSGKTFFDTLGDIILFLFKVLGKFIGILLIIIGAATLIGLFVGLFTVGILDMVHIPGVDFYDMVNSTDAPVWLVSLLTFFVVGIPFFFLLYLGLKILVNNLKSIGNIAKFSLLGLWLLSLIGLTVLGVKQASAHAYTGSKTINESLYFPAALDTLTVNLRASEYYENQENVRFDGMTITYNDDGERFIYSDDIRFDIKKAEDSVPQIRIRKDANGSSFENARDRAAKIEYAYAIDGSTLVLNDYLTTAIENKLRDQEVRVTVFVPEGTHIRFDESAKRHIGRTTRYDKDLYRSEIVDYLWIMGDNGQLQCVDCPESMDEDSDDDANGRIIIDEDGIKINIEENGDSFKMKLDENGVEIKADEDSKSLNSDPEIDNSARITITP
ncbi:PspC domain-containing protein [Poritiphilus flavus]|uniref:PspC domain-containing protein n=1 Tax=Poritiphilus flavus TaxID=2697053 RepID=A0A6L9EA40_9FLAO|nr:PspC domain-containing protein [Poritiphilus flavus]NAS11560.1 PspC domain-containing protein [Poritiphilus flavus]